MTTKNLPKNWTLCTLGDIGRWGSGGTPLRSHNEYYNGNIPWLKIGDLEDGNVLKAETYITEKGLKNSSAKVLDIDTLLIAMYGSIGKLGITKIKCATNQAIAYCVPNESKILLKFLFHFLLFNRNNFFKLAKGGTQQNISQTVLKAYPISLPSLREQHRIVEKIEKLFKQIDSSVAFLQKTQEKIAQFRDVIIRKEVFLKRKAFHYKQYSLGEALIYEQPTKYIVKSTKYDDSYGTPVLTPGKSFIKGYTNETFGIFEKDLPVIIFDDFTTASKFVTFPFKVKSSAMKILHANKHIADIKYMFYIISQIKSTKGTHKRYWISEYAPKLVNLPSLPKQHKIVAEIERQFAAADKMQKAVDNALENAKKLKQAILKKAFNGELVPQDPKDEPASALLAKIKAEREASKHNLKQSKRTSK